MGQFLTDIGEINNSIQNSDLFDLQILGIPNEIINNDVNFKDRFLHKFINFGACVSNIAFSKQNKEFYVTFLDFSDGKILQTLTPETLEKGMRLVLCDRSGNKYVTYEFKNCKLKDTLPITLSYEGNNYLLQRHPYILIFAYSNVYKNVN